MWHVISTYSAFLKQMLKKLEKEDIVYINEISLLSMYLVLKQYCSIIDFYNSIKRQRNKFEIRMANFQTAVFFSKGFYNSIE